MFGILADTFMTATGYGLSDRPRSDERRRVDHTAACQGRAPDTKASMKPERAPFSAHSTGK